MGYRHKEARLNDTDVLIRGFGAAMQLLPVPTRRSTHHRVPLILSLYAGVAYAPKAGLCGPRGLHPWLQVAAVGG